jgi:hypothetical protein
MEALSFMVLVSNGGVGVVAAGCGGRRWFSFFFPLLSCAVFFLCFFSLLAVFLPQFQWLQCASGATGGDEEENWRSYVEDTASVFLYFLLLPPL